MSDLGSFGISSASLYNIRVYLESRRILMFSGRLTDIGLELQLSLLFVYLEDKPGILAYYSPALHECRLLERLLQVWRSIEDPRKLAGECKWCIKE